VTVSAEQQQIRNRALAGLVITLALAVGGWIFLRRATDAGIERLARIDTLRDGCVAQWTSARNEADSQRVDAVALRDTIDPRSATALKRCGDLRAIVEKKLPNAREMSGEPMPKGLR
jgi:hypothetical protein